MAKSDAGEHGGNQGTRATSGLGPCSETQVGRLRNYEALAALVFSGHASDELPNDCGHAHRGPVRGHGRVLVRRVSHEHRRAIIGRVPQRPTGFPAANSFRPHMDSMHLGLAAFSVLVVVGAPGAFWRPRMVPSRS